MSRIGKKPIPLPSGVSVEIGDGIVRVQGSQGSLEQTYHTALVFFAFLAFFAFIGFEDIPRFPKRRAIRNVPRLGQS